MSQSGAFFHNLDYYKREVYTMQKILVVDDEKAILDIVSRYLAREGYKVFAAANGKEALTFFQKESLDLIITDIMMPEMDGYDFIEQVLEKDEGTPFIFVSAKDQEKDKIFSLTLGADDFITKPFSPRELTLRVKNILRRVGSKEERAGNAIEEGPFRIDEEKFKASLYDRPLELSIKEFQLLLLFLKNLGKVFPKSELYEKIWHSEYFDDANTLNVHIHSLREKLEKVADERPYPHIQTVWGLGYKMEG